MSELADDLVSLSSLDEWYYDYPQLIHFTEVVLFTGPVSH